MALAPFCLFAQASLNGDWKMEVKGDDGQMRTAKFSFDAEGNYMVDFGMDGAIDIRGKYEQSGNQITIWDISGEYSCPSEMKGVYDIEISESAMKVDRVSDDCQARGSGTPLYLTRL